MEALILFLVIWLGWWVVVLVYRAAEAIRDAFLARQPYRKPGNIRKEDLRRLGLIPPEERKQ